MLGYISFKTRILLSFVLVLSLMISIVAYTLINNSKAEREMGDIDNTFLPYALLAGRMGLDVVQVQQFLTDVSATHNEEGYKDADEAAQDFKQGLVKFREHQTDSTEQLRKLAEIEKDFDKFYNDGKRMAAAYIHNGLDAGNLIMEDFDQSSLALASKMNEFRDAEVANTTAHVHETTERARFASMIMWVLSAVSIVFGLGVALLLIRYLNSQLGIDPKFAKEIANEIAEGNLTRNIQLSKGDTSSLLFAMKNMQQHLLERLTRDAQEHASMLRIKMALDKASSNLMMADAEYNIIYMNEALLDMFGKAQQDIRKALPGFDVTKLMGANIDIFHKNPAHQRSLLDNLQATIKSSLVIGGRHINIIANPVFNATGERLGTVVEWADRTHEVIIENEIEAIVEAVKAGELGSRLSVADKTGFFAELSKGINELTSGIEKVFNDIASVMQSMASGDLTLTITNDYEGVYGNCKNDINATLDKLSQVFSQIKESANFIANSSQEIASGNNNLSHRAEEQAASLEETASSMEELTSTVKENAHNAQNANKVATNAGELAEKGGAVVVSAVKAMQEINESSNKIAAIIGVIDEIAFQTNLLALNASVEAARAGEHGRGFSVVATEVRNLAQRSATAARESKALIHNSIQKVRVGTEFVNETGRSLNEIVNGVKEVGAIIAEIAAASVQQSAGIEQVNMAIAQMDEITQQNAALAEEASAASVSMSEQTNNMSDLLAFFQLPYSAPSSASAPLAGKSIVSASRNTGASKIANPKKAPATTSDSDDMWDEF